MLSKINLAFNIVLLLAVAFLFFRTEASLLEGSSPSPSDETPSDSTEFASSTKTKGFSDFNNPRIAYVDAERLNEEYQFIAEKYEELEKEQMRIESQIERKLRAAEERYLELEAQAPSMTPTMLQDAQMELQNLQQDITRFQEQAATDFRKKEASAQEQFFGNISSFLEKLNQEGRYDYVLTYQIGGQILLANDSLNITDEVVRGLNEEYRASKQSKAQ